MATVATGTDDLLADLDQGVFTLTMNRPKARNAVSRAMVAALAEQLGKAELDPEVRCIALTGVGKGFCAGGDLYDCLDLEAIHHVHCGQTEDHRNAAKAFVDKREPVFQGR
jgi:enoyl-CoA hydratase/carnithine racemase